MIIFIDKKDIRVDNLRHEDKGGNLSHYGNQEPCGDNPFWRTFGNPLCKDFWESTA